MNIARREQVLFSLVEHHLGKLAGGFSPPPQAVNQQNSQEKEKAT